MLIQSNQRMGAQFKTSVGEVHAREVLDSRGFPTIEVEVVLVSPHGLTSSEERVIGRAIVPSGASTGEAEALELRDQDLSRYQGKGVLCAVKNVREKIAPALLGKTFASQALLDQMLLDLDGSCNKTHLGANSLLGVSMAFARAQASAQHLTLAASLADSFGSSGTVLPVPLMNVLNGGRHADNGFQIQEFMIIPAGFNQFSKALRAGVEIFHSLKKILSDSGLSVAVGDEGGFAPRLEGDRPHEQALRLLLQAISKAGYSAGKDIFLGLDIAASEFFHPQQGYLFEGQFLSSEQMINLYQHWIQEFPIISVEDALAEGDWSGWKQLTAKLTDQCQLVGDDLFVTQAAYLHKGIESAVGNAILIKLNQVGTVTETLETMKMAGQAHYHSIVSHRSGETEDTFLVDLAVGTDCGQVKTGSASRTDRVAKYNELLRYEERLGQKAQFAGLKVFEQWLR